MEEKTTHTLKIKKETLFEILMVKNWSLYDNTHDVYEKWNVIRKGGDIGMFITLVPKNL